MTIKAKFVKAFYKTRASIKELVYWYKGYYLRLSLGRQGFDSLINRNYTSGHGGQLFSKCKGQRSIRWRCANRVIVMIGKALF